MQKRGSFSLISSEGKRNRKRERNSSVGWEKHLKEERTAEIGVPDGSLINAQRNRKR